MHLHYYQFLPGTEQFPALLPNVQEYEERLILIPHLDQIMHTKNQDVL